MNTAVSRGTSSVAMSSSSAPRATQALSSTALQINPPINSAAGLSLHASPSSSSRLASPHAGSSPFPKIKSLKKMVATEIAAQLASQRPFTEKIAIFEAKIFNLPRHIIVNLVSDMEPRTLLNYIKLFSSQDDLRMVANENEMVKKIAQEIKKYLKANLQNSSPIDIIELFQDIENHNAPSFPRLNFFDKFFKKMVEDFSEYLTRFIELGGDINVNEGFFLHKAIHNQILALVKLILNYGANPNIPYKFTDGYSLIPIEQYQTPLSLAKKAKHYFISERDYKNIQLLIKEFGGKEPPLLRKFLNGLARIATKD